MFKLADTRDYSVFKYHTGNRPVNKPAVRKLEESIRLHGQISPIVVSPDMFVIDGQHRLEALRQLRLPVWYVVNYNYRDTQLVESNVTQRGWRLPDFIRFRASKGDWNCEQLAETIARLKHISPAAVTMMYSKTSQRGIDHIRYGHFYFEQEKGDQYLKYLNRLVESKFISERNVYSFTFITSLVTVVHNNPEFQIETLIKGLEKLALPVYDDQTALRERIVEVYNIAAKPKQRIKI